MLKVPAVQCLQLLVIMTEATSCQTLKPYKNITEVSWSKYCKYCNCSKYKKDLTYLNLSPSERTRESAKLINLWSLLKQTKAEARAG